MQVKHSMYTCIYNFLPEDELLRSKHAHKLKYYFRRGAFCWFVLYNCIGLHGAKT